MATKNAKSNKKGVATKATETVEVAEVETPVIEVSEDVVLDAPSDITAVADGNVVCSACNVEKEQTVANFSPMAKGGFRNICKPCQTQASLAWTTKRADYRKDYQRAIQLINLGIPAIVPNAKDWVSGDVIMTVAYTDKNGVEIPSRVAEEVYAEMKQAVADARAERKAELDAQNAELKAQRQAERAELKAQRDAERAEAKEQRQAERAELRAQRDAERAEKAEQAKADREAKAVERANERAVKNAEKAETARLAREAKAVERAEAQKQKALDKAQAIADKAEARRQSAVEKAMSATA
jgi:hypothetical protein